MFPGSPISATGSGVEDRRRGIAFSLPLERCYGQLETLRPLLRNAENLPAFSGSGDGVEHLESTSDPTALHTIQGATPGGGSLTHSSAARW